MARVLVLTAPSQSADLKFLLEEEGHEPVFVPLLGAPVEPSPGLRAAAEQLGRFTWVVVMSRGALHALRAAVNAAGTSRALRAVQWLVADAACARAVERDGGAVRVPGDGKWTSAISGAMTAGDDVLLLHHEPLTETVVDALDAAGVRVTALQLPEASPLEWPDAAGAQVVIVHSAAAGEAWVEATREAAAHVHDEYCCGPHVPHEEKTVRRIAVPGGVKVVAATPAVASALQALGVPVYATAAAPAADAVVDATLGALSE